MKYAKVLGTGSYLPENIVTNLDLEQRMETSDEWIVSRTGIKARHLAGPNDTALSMAKKATERALQAADLPASAIDMIIVASTTPQMVFPSTACLLQAELGVSGGAAFDLNATACAGFMYAFSIAEQYIKTGKAKHVLVIGSEVMSQVVDWEDRSVCVLFGDGAGAVLLGASESPGVLSTHIFADGRYKDVLYLPLGTRSKPNLDTIKMQGNALFKLAVNILGDLFDQTLAANGVTKAQIDWLVPHQANIRIIQAMAKKLALPLSQVTITLETQGNTSSASIPIALDLAIRDGRIKPGQLLMLEGFGGGLAWGSALVRY